MNLNRANVDHNGKPAVRRATRSVVLVGISLLGSAGLGALWLRSICHSDFVGWEQRSQAMIGSGAVDEWIPGDRSLTGMESADGHIWLGRYYASNHEEDAGTHWYFGRTPFREGGRLRQNWYGFHFGRVGNQDRGWSAQGLMVPHVLLVLVSLGPAACVGASALARARNRRRARSGLCERCGYDLRASTERCPECGTVITPPTVT
jgi:hypothetical protein